MLHCPQCGSTRIYLIAGGFTGYRYHCKACDYEGVLVVTTPKEEEEDHHDPDKA
jgi:transposase-like protein